MKATQIIFGIALFFVIVAAPFAATLLGIDWRLTLLTWISALSVVWFIFSGEKIDQMPFFIRGYAASWLSHWSTLACATITTVVIALGIGYLIFGSRTAVFVPEGASSVEIYETIGETETWLGNTSEETPLRLRFLRGTRQFVGRAKGFEDFPTSKVVGWSIPWPWQPDVRIVMELKPKIVLEFDEINPSGYVAPRLEDAVIGQERVQDYPQGVRNLLSQKVSFSINSASPTPIQLSKVEIEVVKVKRLDDWLFPYYNEPHHAEAGILNGYAVLPPEPGTISPEWPELVRIGKGLDEQRFNVRLFSDAGRKYHLLPKVTCHDVNDHERPNKIENGPEFVLDFPNDWRQLITPDSTLEIVYYSQANQLAKELVRLGLLKQAKLFIADEEAPAHLEVHPIQHRLQYRVCDDVEIKSLIKVLGSHPDFPDRPKNCILINGKKLLLQKGEKDSSLSRADLITDSKRIDNLRRLLSTLSKK